MVFKTVKLKNNVLHFCSVLFLLFVFTSCKKEKQIDVEHITLSVYEDVNVQSITFLNNTIGFVCGGIKGQSGVIFKTIDGGYSWQKIHTGANNCLYSISFINDSVGFACGENRLLLKTVDGGQTWLNQYSQIPPPVSFNSTFRTICNVNDTIIYVAGGNGYEVGLTYTSYDGGAHWAYNTFDTELRSIYFKNKYIGYFSGYGTILQTVDSGYSFHPLPIDNDFFVSLAFPSNDIAYACGYNGGIYKTNNAGNSWEDQLKNNNDLIHNRHFNQLKFMNVNEGYAVGNSGLIIYTNDGGGHWKRIKKFTDDNLYSVAIKNSHEIFITGSNGAIYLLKP